MRKFIVFLILFSISCVTTGPGGKTDFIFISTAEEVEIGRQVAAEVESQERLLKDKSVQTYVNNVGQKIARVSDRNDIEYTFKVIDKKEINAFACPGGFIYIYTGLLETLDNEAQLAAVLAHEVSHLVARHSIKKLQNIYGYSILAQIALGDKAEGAAGDIVNVAASLILQGYSRDNEFEADRYGILYAKNAGYNPKGMIEVFEKFKKMQGTRPPSILVLLSSHPPAEDRIERAESEIRNVLGTGLPYYEDRYKDIKSLL
ncbi:MAG: M48 family metallopeptidase [candidate division WOR-3 bacterium]|jgi:beta-barrel assembly-enhancing protease